MKYFYTLIVTAILLCGFNSYALDINDSLVAKAITENDVAQIENFIAQGLNVNARDENGNTILYRALIKNRLDIAQKLIDAGADVNAPSAENGKTPLIIATSRADELQKKAAEAMEQADGYTQNRAAEIRLKKYILRQMSIARKMLEMLITNGADVNQETPFGTPLMNASRNAWNMDLIDTLLKADADVNFKDRSGRTALFYGEIFGGDLITTKLISAGADIDIKDNRGKNYMELTKEDFEEN